MKTRLGRDTVRLVSVIYYIVLGSPLEHERPWERDFPMLESPNNSAPLMPPSTVEQVLNPWFSCFFQGFSNLINFRFVWFSLRYFEMC